MNRVVVTRAAAGLAAYLKDTGAPAGALRRHRVRRPPQLRRLRPRHRRGDDRRRAAGAGVPRPLPTPLLAFAIRELGCVAGVMVTASHNPPQDNGYKVYLGDGSQIVPPADAEIAARIAAVGAAGRRAPRRRRQGPRRGHRRPLPRHRRRPGGRRAARPAHRLHAAARRRWHVGAAGAGDRRLRRARRWSSSRRSPTRSSRRWPSPTPRSRARWTSPWRSPRRTTSTWWSPTTRTPTGARPPSRASTGGGCCAATRSARCSATTCCTQGKQGTYACSIVSSSLLGKMAAAHGQPYVETLTGFKWISRVPGPRVRLRGGARLLRRPRAREGQGRRLGAAAALRARRHRRRPTAAPSSTCSTTSPPDARPARHRPALDPRRRPVADRGRRWPGCGDARRPRSAGWPSSPSTTCRWARPTCRRPTACATGSPRAPASSSARRGTEPKLKCYLEVVVPVHPDDGVDAARICRRRPARRHQGATSRRPRHLTDSSAASEQRSRPTRRRAPVTTRPAISGQAQWRRTGGRSARARAPAGPVGQVQDPVPDVVGVGQLGLAVAGGPGADGAEERVPDGRRDVALLVGAHREHLPHGHLVDQPRGG